MSNLQDAAWHYGRMAEEAEREAVEAAKAAHPATGPATETVRPIGSWWKNARRKSEHGGIARRLVAGIALAGALAIGVGACGSSTRTVTKTVPGPVVTHTVTVAPAACGQPLVDAYNHLVDAINAANAAVIDPNVHVGPEFQTFVDARDRANAGLQAAIRACQSDGSTSTSTSNSTY